jgi:diguanylate cyclase
LHGTIVPHVPTASWAHLVFIVVIFVVTGFSVYILVRDIKRLMLSLQQENAKVQQSQVELQHIAHHDPLTRLPNRFYGEVLFAQCLAECQRNQQSLALLFIDLDNFKPVNDVLGHAAGDLLLEKLAIRLKNILQGNQYIIRFGGDEFLILAATQEGSDHLNLLAETLIKQCESEFEILQNQIVISASIGIACAPKDGTNFKQLCRRADIAMYQAKQNGRNTYHYYDESLEKASDDKFKLLQLLRAAQTARQFELYYQPMVNLDSQDITTVEALLRWPQADGSMIPPVQFIPLAESSGLIIEIGRWVIEEACLFCAAQRRLGLSQLRVSVNLSVMQFKEGDLHDIVKGALKQAALAPDALELELTESLLIDESDLIKQQLAALSHLGVSIAIDDFGTGYSNLGYLRNFNASKLKIDRSFITSLCVSTHDEPLVKAIINMAASMGMKTVAEGIEDEATLNKLISLGCNIGQGYYWSKPIPGDELSRFLKNHQNSSKD